MLKKSLQIIAFCFLELGLYLNAADKHTVGGIIEQVASGTSNINCSRMRILCGLHSSGVSHQQLGKKGCTLGPGELLRVATEVRWKLNV